MLRLFAENSEGEVKELTNLNSLILEREEGVAGDLLTLTLEGAIFSELVSLTVFENSEEILGRCLSTTRQSLRAFIIPT